VNEIPEDVMGGACGTHGRDEGCIRILVGRPREKRRLERSRRRWEDSINIDLTEI
jgi:hypothetical protein